ncbi:hypothetical protein vseg_008720 [Gypsophila vaccaria]
MSKSCMTVAFMLLLMIRSSYGSLARCKEHELEALLKFKQSYAGVPAWDPASVVSLWVGEDCCQWQGVSCDHVTGNVVKLIVRGPQDLQGKIDPVHEADYSWQPKFFSPALLELNFLTHLDLSYNDYSATKFPEFIASMTSLRHLDLSYCNFLGPIPPQLGNVTNLIHLDLYAAMDSNTPQERVEWVSRLSKLQSLDMGFIDLSLAKDTTHVLFTLPSLSVLGLGHCNLREPHFPKFLVANSSSSTLRQLDLSFNNFLGPFPSFLQNMSSLRSLSLRNNALNGSVPLWLRNMRSLEHLDLISNGFNKVEGGMWGIIGNPCIFKYLDLSNNDINQENFLDPYVNSTKCVAYDFEYLDLNRNGNLQGNLPSLLGRLTKLTYLDLSFNEFEGGLPMSISGLSALKYLDLSHNRLSGSIPDDFGHLTEIQHLDTSSNSLHGTVSGIGNLSNLVYLDMNFNNINFTSSFNRVPAFQIQVFHVYSCAMNTVFPQWLMNQTQIISLDLSYTGISGEVPKWLWNMTNIQQLLLSGNQLTGTLPPHIPSVNNFFMLNLPQSIPCEGCNIEVLALYDNMFSGKMPQWLCHLPYAGIVDLSENLLSGAIFEGENASSLLTATNNMYVLDLSDNMLSGEIQIKTVVPDAPLEILNLRGNNFTGLITSQLCNFPNLIILELAQNHLTGHIPSCLGSVRFDSRFNLNSFYDVDIQENIKGTTERFYGFNEIHSAIDLSSNRLVGSIPEELTNISKLMQLYLSNNLLTGGIPRDIGNLRMLESLDLSNNNLSGTIPQSLSAIPWLTKLNLSNNRLHGPIPTGSQLQTLDDPSIYSGNSGLCGPPLSDQCTERSPPHSPTNIDSVSGKEDEDSENDVDNLWLYLAIMSGVAVGFWGVVGTLVVKKRWRHAYFRFVEDSTDKIYAPVKVRTNRLRNRLRKKTREEISNH